MATGAAHRTPNGSAQNGARERSVLRRIREAFLGTESASPALMRSRDIPALLSLRMLGLLVFAPMASGGCAASHATSDDGGTGGDGAVCAGSPALICVSDCASDAGRAAICVGGVWSCPPGTRDLSTCTTSMCPSGLNPWDPTDPLRACAREGATCTSGSDPCGSGMFCTCTSGLWECAVAEPDPVCWCGREPSEGDRCAEEGASCGECCPTPGGTGWPAMQCVGGHWTAAACPAVPCPRLDCPADTRALLGRSCSSSAEMCGDPCCGSAVTCTEGVWAPGPDAECFACLQYPCGDGFCPDSDICTSRCGPADGIEFVCVPSPSGCADCGCLPLTSDQTCEMIDGHPHLSEVGFCG